VDAENEARGRVAELGNTEPAIGVNEPLHDDMGAEAKGYTVETGFEIAGCQLARGNALDEDQLAIGE